MSDNLGPDSPELTYESALPRGISKWRRTTWIALLIVGILSIISGLVAGGWLVFLIYLLSQLADSRTSPWIWIFPAAFLVIPPAAGIVEIICSIRIKNRSFAAALVAAILVGLQFLIVVALAVYDLVAPALAESMSNIALYLVIALPLAAIELLLIKVLREPRQPG